MVMPLGLRNRAFAVLVGLILGSSGACGADEDSATSLQVKAFAANAGGQDVYALRRTQGVHEFGFMLNESLLAGGKPLVGAMYDYRFDLCGLLCPVNAYLAFGAGISTAGPFIEVTWGMGLFWLTRLDFSSHIYLSQDRFVVWSYPLWFGISVPL